MNLSQQPSQRIRHLGAAFCFGIIALQLAATLGCGAPTRKPSAAQGSTGPARVETIVVTKQKLTQTIEMSGTIEGDETVDLYAKVGGFLEEIGVDIGDRVEAGQVLARLSIPEMAKELDHQQASVKSAQAMMQRAEAGIRQAQARIAGGEAALVEAKTQRSEKEAELKLRRAEFERTKELVDRGSFLAKKLDEATFSLETVVRSGGGQLADGQQVSPTKSKAHPSFRLADVVVRSGYPWSVRLWGWRDASVHVRRIM